jgi:hypothetical protein
MCSLRFVWNIKDAAVSAVRQQSMCSPWTHCLTPNSPDFTPSDFSVSWGTFCAFSTRETHNLHANVTVHFTQITSQTLSDRLEELASGWDISSVSVKGLTVREKCPVCVGCMCQILNSRMEEAMFYKVSLFFTTQIGTYFCIQGAPGSNPIKCCQLWQYLLGFRTPSWECL